MELGFLSQDLKCQSDGQGGTRREWNVHLPRVRMKKKAEGQDMVEVSGQRTHRCNCKAVTMNY